MERRTSQPTVLRRCTMDHTPAGHGAETVQLPPIDQHALATGPGRIKRMISPSVIQDIDLPNGPYNVHRDYPPPPNGHDIMRIFPTLPPDHSGPTSSFFRQQEHLYFAHPGREIVRVCIESDFNPRPVMRSGFQREPWSVDGVMRRVALAQPAEAHDTVTMRPPLSHSQTHSDHTQYQNSLPYNTHTQYQNSLPFQQYVPYHQSSPPRQHAPEANTYRITPVSSWQDKVQYHCFYHSYRHSDTPQQQHSPHHHAPRQSYSSTLPHHGHAPQGHQLSPPPDRPGGGMIGHDIIHIPETLAPNDRRTKRRLGKYTKRVVVR